MLLPARRNRGFDPRLGLRTVVTPQPLFRSLVRTLALGCALATAMTVVAAGPAYADSLTISSKSVSAPLGFDGVCQRYAWACAKTSASKPMSGDSLMALADRTNRVVNRTVREVSDQRQYGQRDYWALPTTRGGDCEDFALLKKRELIRAGVSAKRLLIATALDRRERPHAVLVLRTEAGDFVLDNLTSRIKPWHKTGYSFLRMQDPTSETGWRLINRGGIFG